ncbi:MAG: hypothetical protein SGCHY_003265 [Lobulomycetales sp.]
MRGFSLAVLVVLLVALPGVTPLPPWPITYGISSLPDPSGFYARSPENYTIPWSGEFCPTGKLTYEWRGKRNSKNKWQAKRACEACYGDRGCKRVPWPANVPNGAAWGSKKWIQGKTEASLANAAFFSFVSVDGAPAGRVTFANFNQSYDLGIWDEPFTLSYVFRL